MMLVSHCPASTMHLLINVIHALLAAGRATPYPTTGTTVNCGAPYILLVGTGVRRRSPPPLPSSNRDRRCRGVTMKFGQPCRQHHEDVDVWLCFASGSQLLRKACGSDNAAGNHDADKHVCSRPVDKVSFEIRGVGGHVLESTNVSRESELLRVHVAK